MRVRNGVLCLALGAVFPASTWAADNADIRALREQLRELRETYQKRIEDLERRLAETEARSAKAAEAAKEASAAVGQVEARAAQAEATAESVARRPVQANAFNPEISLILDSKFTRLQRDPGTYRITGFLPQGGEIAPPRKGFSLGESELAISANVDHLFRGNARFSVAEDSGAGAIDVEEASIETLALPAGFKLKAGRFLSGVGYLNQQHPHEWDFTDAPLAYKAFFGYRLRNDGMALRWVAPTETFLEFGSELAQGEGLGGSRNTNGAGLWTAFAHVGGDIDESSAWQAGLSHVHTNPQGRQFSDTDAAGVPTVNAFTGRSRTWIADFVYKWAPNGNPQDTNFKLQGEYFVRQEDGLLTCADADPNSANPSACTAAASSDARFHQSGWYLQSVYQFMPRWRLGYRYDRLAYGTADLGSLSSSELPILERHSPTRNSVMVDWSPSEFSRLRLQVARDKSRLGEPDSQLWLQYIMSMGAHGAHKF